MIKRRVRGLSHSIVWAAHDSGVLRSSARNDVVQSWIEVGGEGSFGQVDRRRLAVAASVAPDQCRRRGDVQFTSYADRWSLDGCYVVHEVDAHWRTSVRYRSTGARELSSRGLTGFPLNPRFASWIGATLAFRCAR